jgi:hypothetical protein
MKAVLETVTLLLISAKLFSQNTDLPLPASNIQTLPAGSYVIAMDNTNQVNNSGVFNYKTYGLIVTLLNNNVKLKWVITAGKTKDAIDFTVNATKIKPVAGISASFNFLAGPFVIFAADTTGVAALIDGFNTGIVNVNDKIKVYQTNASVSVDVRYNMTGFVPKAAILTDGGNQNIHVSYMTTCNIPVTNYQTASGPDLLVKCYTFASEPHNDKSGASVDNAITAIKRFVQHGGNFLAQCAAVITYENSNLGHFQSITGITDVSTNAGTNITYPNADLSFCQFDGNFSISKGGSVLNWRVNSSGANNYHKHSRGISDTTVTGSSVSKLFGGSGGLVFYLGSHRFDDQLTTQTAINGLRMYMNAFLTPASLGNCSIGALYAFPLAIKLNSFEGNLNGKTVSFKWSVATNELIEKFTMEKSMDGISFKPLADIPSSDRNSMVNYSMTDLMTTDKVFYRLKIIEHTGEISYSKIIAFTPGSHSESILKIINNPVNDDKLGFQYSAAINQLAEVRILDMTGRLRSKQTISCTQGFNTRTFLLPATLENGMYILDMTMGATHLSTKFIRH